MPRRSYGASADADNAPVNIFDRHAKRVQRQRAALASDSRDYDYLRIEVAERLADRFEVHSVLCTPCCALRVVHADVL